jgi:hypothetical protein
MKWGMHKSDMAETSQVDSGLPTVQEISRNPLVSLQIRASPAIRAHSDAFARLRLSQGRREAMPAHDLRHLYSVRRTTSRRVDHFGSLAEILRANCRRRELRKAPSRLGFLGY